MIGRVRGELVSIDAGTVLVDCSGVGYEVQVPADVLMRLPAPGESVILLTRQIFREDGQSLYGFLEVTSRALFDHLLTVKGCGPKVALSLLGQVGEESVAAAILADDARVLIRATGVGARLAERIILELKEKIQQDAFARRVASPGSGVKTTAKPAEDELIEALLNLGYRRQEAEAAANDALGEDLTTRLRDALRRLQR